MIESPGSATEIMVEGPSTMKQPFTAGEHLTDRSSLLERHLELRSRSFLAHSPSLLFFGEYA
jgi:hypothetical protein